jgi:hypothetical protein
MYAHALSSDASRPFDDQCYLSRHRATTSAVSVVINIPFFSLRSESFALEDTHETDIYKLSYCLHGKAPQLIFNT